MGNLFSASEAVQIGIQIEKNGRVFYAAVAAAALKKEVKTLFEHLAKEEEGHEKAFEHMLVSLRKTEPPESAREEYNAYLKDLAGEHVFIQDGSGARMASGAENNAQALDLAIGFEKDSIALFQKMKEWVPEWEQAAIDSLIAQEKDHLKTLTNVKMQGGSNDATA